MSLELCPAQQRVFDYLMFMLPSSNVAVMRGMHGAGKSLILRKLQLAWGGKLLTMKDFIDASRRQHPLALEETFEELTMAALGEQDIVLIDDLHLITAVCMGHAYPRHGLFHVALNALVNYAVQADKQLIVTSMGCAPAQIEQRACAATIPKFEPEDYEFLCRRMLLPGAAERLDYTKIHRYAANLNAYQLQFACTWLTRYNRVETEQFIKYLREHHLASNVDLHEVQPVDIGDLKGVDDILQSLEANIVLPLENDELAQQLNLRPKRGVLLAGPPGTGKTTIGRALAHRLKSKFFLIDGTIVSGSPEFYPRIQNIFQAAKQSAPCVVFIDDTDVIFENSLESGLYRYLLTMLDGLESETNSQVCVMMTAMNIGNLPPALVRSGRIELWLETRLPDSDARREILRTYVSGLPAELGAIDLEQLAVESDSLTGADIKRLVEDAKTLYAYDHVRKLPHRSAADYFRSAMQTVRQNKEHYALAVDQIRQNPGRTRQVTR